MNKNISIFDRKSVKLHRDRAAKNLMANDFLLVESAERLVERLEDFTRSFPVALDLGCHGGEIVRCLSGRGAIRTFIQTDLSFSMANLARNQHKLTVVCDEEALPFSDSHFDLILSNLTLHWVNDLPGTLIQIRRMLKPDGLFLAALLGGETLNQLRTALFEAEIELEGGLSPRVSPLIDVRDLGNLMTRAGFSLPVVDSDTVTVSYSDPLKLLRDLRGMGETNANNDRRRAFSRSGTILRACEIYLDKFSNSDGQIPATFEILTMTAWAPSPNQQKPLRPGTAVHSLADVLNDPVTTNSQKQGETDTEP